MYWFQAIIEYVAIKDTKLVQLADIQLNPDHIVSTLSCVFLYRLVSQSSTCVSSPWASELFKFKPFRSRVLFKDICSMFRERIAQISSVSGWWETHTTSMSILLSLIQCPHYLIGVVSPLVNNNTTPLCLD